MEQRRERRERGEGKRRQSSTSPPLPPPVLLPRPPPRHLLEQHSADVLVEAVLVRHAVEVDDAEAEAHLIVEGRRRGGGGSRKCRVEREGGGEGERGQIEAM